MYIRGIERSEVVGFYVFICRYAHMQRRAGACFDKDENSVGMSHPRQKHYWKSLIYSRKYSPN